MSQETITRILAIEEAAVKLYQDAQDQAAGIIADAEKSASVVREQTLANVHQRAEQIAAEGRQTAEIERTRIIAQAEAKAQRLESLAEQNFERATDYVLDQIVGR